MERVPLSKSLWRRLIIHYTIIALTDVHTSLYEKEINALGNSYQFITRYRYVFYSLMYEPIRSIYLENIVLCITVTAFGDPSKFQKRFKMCLRFVIKMCFDNLFFPLKNSTKNRYPQKNEKQKEKRPSEYQWTTDDLKKSKLDSTQNEILESPLLYKHVICQQRYIDECNRIDVKMTVYKTAYVRYG